MLVLSRKKGEFIRLGDNGEIKIVVVAIQDSYKVRLGIDAPKHISIFREELTEHEQEVVIRESKLDKIKAKVDWIKNITEEASKTFSDNNDVKYLLGRIQYVIEQIENI